MFQIGTRGSKLATTQAGHVRDWLIDAGFDSQLHIVTTAGDVNMAPVERIGVGVFTQALREALYAGECDIAVHSFKDLPTAPDERFRLVVPQRQDSREALVARDGLSLAQLPQGARVGTSAPRRISQLAALRPDLEIRPLRGNIDTRMSKVTDGELDAVERRAAGDVLQRLTRGPAGNELGVVALEPRRRLGEHQLHRTQPQKVGRQEARVHLRRRDARLTERGRGV